ncbi:hypothetical protein ACQX22_09150 [Corynebacterium diphtheriae]
MTTAAQAKRELINRDGDIERLGTIKRAIGMKVIEVSASSVCLGTGKKA